ncbi:hypothetical protein [Aquamicrobium sp.]|uniref:hypothetical protein n=1 Tax=Aquamicrobium sp. TaxID=1872579 RepID=UPI0025837673|nr:hypothetical protein [Aquamicrobium sp.]
MYKKIITIFISLVLVTNTILAGAVPVISKTTECKIIGSQDYGRVGDVDGKEIFSKTDYLYECNTTTNKQGPCEKWETKKESLKGDFKENVAYKDEIGGGPGELFSLVSAFNGVQYIWAGWKGICTDGTITDFSWAKDPLFWASTVLQAFGEDFGLSAKAACLTSAGLAAGDALVQYTQDDDYVCDPVDEFCDSVDSSDSPDDVISLDEQTWNDALAAYPDLVNYTNVISNEDGIVVVRFQPQVVNGMGADQTSSAAKEAQDKAKEMQLVMDGVVVAAQAATCFLPTEKPDSGGSGDIVQGGGSLTSIETLFSSVVGYWNPAFGAALKVAMKIATSFQSIDTCNNKDDALSKGSRHIKTLTHKAYGMCHMIRDEEKDSSPFTSYTNYHYCCYPDAVSRSLIEQIKAQLGRDWQHCTDLTFQDLEKINFQSCEPTMMSDPGTVDGVKIKWDASFSERQSAFQYKFKCIDYTDLKKTFTQSLGFSVENFKFDNQFNELQQSNFELNNTK